jgi:serine/threonine protein kinase
MDKGIIEKIKYTNKVYPNLEVDLYSNAGLFSKEKADALLQTKIGRITFSINGAEKEDYEKIMKLDYDHTYDYWSLGCTIYEMMTNKILFDADNDLVPTDVEDANNDTNLANDDTDGDGIPNYLDNDDDGDLVLTNLEYVFQRLNDQSSLNLMDTDNDSIPNYLDNDDDGDGVLTWREDYNGDGNPANDDTNTNGLPDYLEFGVALGVQNNSFDNLISLYPNPAITVLNIENASTLTIDAVAIYSINGSLLREINNQQNLETISVADLASGIYFVKIKSNDKVITKKFIKN